MRRAHDSPARPRELWEVLAAFAGAARASGLHRRLRAGAALRLLPVAARTGTGAHLAVMWHARARPDAPAVADAHRSLTYRELDREANRLARAIAARGGGPGDRVALCLPNRSEQVVAQHALARLGASAVHIGTALTASEIEPILENAEPALALTDTRTRAPLFEAAGRVGHPPAGSALVVGADRGADLGGGARYEDAIAAESGRSPPRRADSRRADLIIYTSGTTGRPKGAKRSLRHTGAVGFADLVRRVGIRSDERHLIVCPLYHSGALAFANLFGALGGALVLREGFDAETFLADVERHRIHSAFAVPTMLVRLLELPEETRRRYDLSSLRWIMSGAAPLSPETAVRFQDTFGPILWNFYGSTETGVVTLAGPADHGARRGTIGRPLAGNEIRILGEDGAPAARGEVGELYVKNAMLIAGYHRDDDATRQSVRDGFFSVGDLARQDDEGYLYLVSRSRDMVISGGVNIYPREIEDWLHAHGDIAEAAVVGRPDPEWGEIVHAYVVPRTGAAIDTGEVEAFCRRGLAGFKCPRRIDVVAELPRSPTGKVLKRELLARS